MGFTENLIQSVTVLIGLISLRMFLRRVDALKQAHASVFAKLITDVTLPALIFGVLSTAYVGRNQLLLPEFLRAAGVVWFLLAWAVSRKDCRLCPGDK